MIERNNGTIVFVSSVVGRLPIPYRSSYTASKHALQAFADCLRAEISSHNIHVLVSSPGYVSTEVSRNALTGYGEFFYILQEFHLFIYTIQIALFVWSILIKII